jgi:uncharacterized protein YggU (UPF0235/DUF167 family)
MARTLSSSGVAAPPVNRRANAEAERFLAKTHEVPRSEVAVVREAFSRDKAVLVRGADVGELWEILSGRLP